MLTKIKTILYATDLDEGMKPVLRMAMSLAQQYQAEVTSLHVVEPVSPEVYSWAADGMWDEIKINNVEQSEELSNKQMTRFFEKEIDDTVTLARPDVQVAYGHPATEILKYADKIDADIIVMASHGHSALGELLIGSVADKVMRLSKRPVLMVPVKG